MKGATSSGNDRGSAVSTNDLIIDNANSGPRPDEQTPAKKIPRQTIRRTETTTKTITEPPKFSGVFGISRGATICWYALICLLFVIAFISLIPSVFYFATDTTTEQIIKLYGICGGGTLLVVIIVIICLDCCNDGNRRAREEMARYNMQQAREANERAIAERRRRKLPPGADDTVKISPIPPRKPTANSPQHIHHYHFHPPPGYYLHANDMGVNTTEKFVPTTWSRNTEHGTQTDRTEGTQTSLRELHKIPSNVTEIIHERTILKGPRELRGTMKESMAQQDRQLAIDQDLIEGNTLIAFV